jgi:hypothetical protein
MTVFIASMHVEEVTTLEMTSVVVPLVTLLS